MDDLIVSGWKQSENLTIMWSMMGTVLSVSSLLMFIYRYYYVMNLLFGTLEMVYRILRVLFGCIWFVFKALFVRNYNTDCEQVVVVDDDDNNSESSDDESSDSEEETKKE